MALLNEQEKSKLMLKLPRPCLDREIEAMGCRWWDYRGMSPVDTTYLFAQEYKDATIAWNRMCRDDATAESRARPFVPDDIFQSRDLNAMWMARQHADLLGIPYGFLMNLARQRNLNMTMRHMPRPNQLYSEEFHVDLQAAWAQRCTEFLQLPMSADFRVRLNAYGGRGGWRTEFRAWLFEEVRKRPGPHERILGRLIHEQLCTEFHVASVWDQATADSAARVAALLQAG
jgi:hypothetical protein